MKSGKDRQTAKLEPSQPRGTHPLGAHVWVLIDTARACRPDTHTEPQARALLDALAEAMDLASNVAAAPPSLGVAEVPQTTRARIASRDGQPVGPAPMNPVRHHHGSGESRAPGRTRTLDSVHWRHEYHRVEDLADRCEVVRRAAEHLATLVAPPEPIDVRAQETEAQLRQRVRDEGRGYPLRWVVENLRVEPRTVIIARIEKGLHPITGEHWTPPEDFAAAAEEARWMRDEGLNTADIARALDRNASTVRNWTTKARRMAA